MPLTSINPATGETLKTFDELTDSEIDAYIGKALDAFRDYRLTTFAQRAENMVRAAEILENSKEVFGEIMTTEMGKPIKAAVAEAEKCAWVCRSTLKMPETSSLTSSSKLMRLEAMFTTNQLDPFSP